jgi:signal transduction histidine kinase/DNA-binding LacI/PurR family transcriptional regulator
LTYSQPDTLSIEIWSGLVDFSRERDANLICFPGESLHDPTEFRWQANVLYDLVSAENVDGLVIWGGALEAFDRAGLSARCQRYHPLPMVSIGTSPEGIPGVLVDSYHGMRKAITHLVVVHGYRRIAFICGPPGQSETEARYRAYCDVLAEHGLPFDESLVARCHLQPQVGPEGVSRPPWQMQVGPEAIRLLVDERHADFEALVGVGDSVILVAMEALRARGIHIPGDVAVVGFDDIEDGRYALPPLTTVSFRAYEQGYHAAEMLWALIEGQPVPERTVLPVRLTVRQSCGCMDRTVIEAAARPAAHIPMETRGATFESVLVLQRTDILSAMTEAVTPPALGLEPRWAERLLEAFLADLQDSGASTFLHTLDGVLRQVATADGDVTAWQEVLSALRSHALPCIGGSQTLSRAEDLWQQARVVIGEVAEQARAYWNLRADRENRLLGETGQMLITTFDVTELMHVVARELPRLGLKCGYVALYENPRAPAEWARLLLAYDEEGCLELDAAGRRFPSRQLVPEDLQARDRRCCLVVEPLYFREEQLGFAVLEAGPSQMSICYALRGQLSSALKGALLFRQSVEAQMAAQKADQLKTRLLANVSHELRTPLNTIMGFARLAEDSPDMESAALPPAVLKDLRHIYDNAEHLLRVIDDLLDLSRAEIDELDLYPEMIDTRPFLEQVFHSIADAAVSAGKVAWRLALPERLPMLQADPLRMRQILLNLLNNAQKFTDAGEIVLGAEVAPPSLHMWVQDTGAGIPADQQECIFEPFVTADRADRRPEGIGLGLSVTRRLVALHHGSMRLESQPGQGSIFHVYLPLPSLSDRPAASLAPTQPVLLLLSTQEQPAPEIVELCQRQGWEIWRAQTRDDVDSLLRTAQPAMLAWDMAGAGSSATPGSWTIIQHLRQDPRMSRVPFLFYGRPAGNAASIPAGMVNLVTKPARADTLSQAINALRPPGAGGPILIVDDDPQARELHRSISRSQLTILP